MQSITGTKENRVYLERFLSFSTETEAEDFIVNIVTLLAARLQKERVGKAQRLCGIAVDC